LNVRPPTLARTFTYDDGSPRLKHVIEPFLNYRNISGVDNFARIIRFDARDTVANTNELEYGVVNRFFVPRIAVDGSISTHEMLSISLTQKYFFDTDFGGALQPGMRNQFFPINTLSGFSFGGRERRFSPLNLNLRYRPLSSLSADLRMDYDTLAQKVRNFSVTGSMSRRYFTISERFYHSTQLQISPGMIEPGSFPGSLLVSNLSLGNERNGYYGGTSFTYDFTERRDARTGLTSREGLRRSSTYIGYACDCGTIEVSFTTFNVGGFRESRISFSFTLSGIGSFGTDRLQQ
ncbi:MAG: LPS assembly protein LptD, partial [Acidobacteriota bacterium]